MFNFKLFSDPFNLYLAWLDFKKGKTKKADTVLFERNLEDNLFCLSEELFSDSYKHQSYTTFFIRDPKFREINVASVRDRIIHQALFNDLYLFFSKKFFFDSFSSQAGKGTHLAIQRVEQFIARVGDNFRKPIWILHGDIKNFFANVNHQILINQLCAKIKDENYIKLCWQVISSYNGVQGRGIPLGNLTSQIFANIYLHELDFYVKQILRVKHYVRYNDDFYIISDKHDKLFVIGEKIKQFVVEKLKLEIPNNKLLIKNINSGVDILGAVIYPWGKIPRKRLRIRSLKALENFRREGYNIISWPKLVSYIGSLQHSRSFMLQEKLRLNIAIV